MTYKVQIGDEVRQATPEETARIDAAHAEHEAQAQAAAEQAALAASGRAKLKALGLTDEEIAALGA
jgi:hypothetical protein